MPENQFLHFFIIMTIIVFSFSLLYKLLDCWAESIKERRRLNTIIEKVDEIQDDPEDDPPSRREVRLG